MRNSRFSTQQILGILAETASGMTVAQICAKHGISVPTFYLWRSKHTRRPGAGVAMLGAEGAAEALAGEETGRNESTGDLAELRRRVYQLERENELLRKLFVEASLAQASVHSLGRSRSVRSMPDIA